MPVVIFMVGAALFSIAMGLMVGFIVYVVLPATMIGLLIWAGVYFYQQNKKNEDRKDYERQQRDRLSEQQRAEEQKQLELQQAQKQLRTETLKLLAATRVTHQDPTAWSMRYYTDLRAQAGAMETEEEERIAAALNGPLMRDMARFSVFELPHFQDEAQERAFQEQLKPHVGKAQQFDSRLYHQPFFDAMLAYRTQLPKDEAPFKIPLHELPIANKIVYDMCNPFWEPTLASRNILSEMRDKQRAGAESVGSSTQPVWPKDYHGPNAHKIYLPKDFWPLFEVEVPFKLEEKERYRHHWCMGPYGGGKTTFLRHLIKADLDAVHRGECSLLVMDSKKLIREMRDYAWPQGPVSFRPQAAAKIPPVTIIDADTPFALNPFYLPPQQGKDVIRYMLSNVGELMSGLQGGALGFLINGAMAYEQRSLATIRDFFALPKGEMPDRFDKFDENTQHWFANNFGKLHPRTKDGVHERLMNFMDENKLLMKYLNASSFQLDLFKELHFGGRVVLIDTNRDAFGKEGTNIFGRLIIKLIDGLSDKRTPFDERKLKPIWCYFDEAQDYIEKDEAFADILTKARAQRIGMTVAHHHTGQLDARIEQSLNQAGIKSECPDPGEAKITVRRKTFSLPVKPFEFVDHLPHMLPADYHRLRIHLAKTYPFEGYPPVIQGDQPLTQKFQVYTGDKRH